MVSPGEPFSTAPIFYVSKKKRFLHSIPGSQFLEGTTDVTRTFHCGEPTEFQISAYTRVLLGSIDLARATFPAGVTDTRLDILARSHLFKVGLNYRHGTGHGIGAYGPIHESPTQVPFFLAIASVKNNNVQIELPSRRKFYLYFGIKKTILLSLLLRFVFTQKKNIHSVPVSFSPTSLDTTSPTNLEYDSRLC